MHTAPPLFSRALLALTAAATIAVTPFGAAAIGPAGSGQSAHSVPVYLISRISHDVGHNDWAFQGQDAGRVSWVVTYVALALFWLGVSLWLRTRTRRAEALTADAAASLTEAVESGGAEALVAAAAETSGAKTDRAEALVAAAAETSLTKISIAEAAETSRNETVLAEAAESDRAEAVVAETSQPRRRMGLWLRVLLAAWAAELVTGLLTLGAGAYAEWTSTPIGADVLKAADLCSPWWSCVAAVLVVARAERSAMALRSIVGYAAMLIIVLMVPLSGPDAVKVLLIALPAIVPALLMPRQQSESDTDPNAPVTQSAVVTG